jgi:site-specific recombinase XerD
MFREWLDALPEPPAEVADITRAQVQTFIAERQEVDASTTVLTRFRVLRAWGNFLEREDIVERSPLARMREPSAPLQPPPVLTTEELRALLDTCRGGRDFTSRRDYSLLAFLAETGIRVGEAADLLLANVDLQNGVARVIGKGRRERDVAFGPKVGKAVAAYERVRTAHPHRDDPHLWVGQRGGLREGALWEVVRDRGLEAGIVGMRPHLLRHTFAHRFRSKGGNESDLAELGGWRSQAMLRRYGQSAASQRAVEAHRRVDPLGDVL